MSTGNIKKEILVYAHWLQFDNPKLMGVLSVTPSKEKESFAFEYNREWLQSGFSQMIDPDLQLFSGAFYHRDEKKTLVFFLIHSQIDGVGY